MDKALKQRLVGASVLIILAVIVLPMLLSGRPDTLQQGSAEIEIPQKPEQVSISKRRFPVGIPDKPVSATQAQVEEDATADLVGDIDAQSEELADLQSDVEDETVASTLEAPVEDLESAVTAADTAANVAAASDPASSDLAPVDQASDPIDTPEPEKAPTVTKVQVVPEPVVDMAPIEASSNSPRYLVQVASFSSVKRADTLAANLRKSGMTVEVDVVERNGGELNRVRVGPYGKRADADAAVAKIKAGSKGLSPRVMDLRPDDALPVSTPSDPLVRWVVQVGSFSSPESADAQVAQLRLAGLPAFAEKVTSSSGSVFKVRVGPEIDRDKATALARKIKQEQNIEGFVTTQE